MDRITATVEAVKAAAGVPVEQIMVEGADIRARDVRSLGQSDEEDMMEALMEELEDSGTSDSETY